MTDLETALNNDEKWTLAGARRERCLLLIRQGLSVQQALADPQVKVSYSAYRKWRERHPRWAAAVDVARREIVNTTPIHQLTSAQFALKYFGRQRTAFQQLWINDIEAMRLGNIHLALWPPEHGKTTTFEDYATEKICRQPEWRNTTGSESDKISKRVIGRVRDRLEPHGPFPALVRDWGPFRPDVGRGREESAFHKPWNREHFSVQKKAMVDERDHTMLAIGWKSSTVSIRTDHLHLDDLQSTKTLTATPTILNWFRQDALSRPGEHGITTIAMTRVGDDDFPSHLEDDDELDGILRVLKFPAIIKNAQGEDEPLWPERYTLDMLDRIRRKVKDEAFDRNYMMSPGASKKTRTFTDDGKALALCPARSLNSYTGYSDPRARDEMKPVVVLSLDPGIDPGYTTLDGWIMRAESLEQVHAFESNKLVRNEEIIAAVETACKVLSPHFRVAHLAIEAANFQRGLARDERLKKVKERYGFTMNEHLTGINKYDVNIGVASMAGDWEAGKILLPYSADKYTRSYIDETCRQLKAWKPLARGSKLRQDRVMSMWFAWIYWQSKRRTITAEPVKWRRQGLLLPGGAKPQLIIPIGATL